MKYRSIIHIKYQNEELFFKSLDKILQNYSSAGFEITIVCADNEFKLLTDKVKDDIEFTMNYTNPGYHVPDIDRNNRTVNERYHAKYHRLPFWDIPKVMIRYLYF